MSAACIARGGGPLLTAVVLALAGSVAAPPSIPVRIDAAEAAGEAFMVRVIGHYADLHLGRSRHLKDVLVPVGEPVSVGLGAINPITSAGLSVLVYHPEYVYDSARSRRTPLPMVPVSFPPFRPRRWDAVPDGDAGFDNGGPRRTLHQVVGHLQLFLDGYLAAVDRATPSLAPGEARMARYLKALEGLVRRVDVDRDGVPVAAEDAGGTASTPEARRAAVRDLEQQALARELLRRAGEWVSLSPAARVRVRKLMADMRYARTVGEDLMSDGDHARVGRFLDARDAARRERREPQPALSWTSPESRVSFRARARDASGACAWLDVTVDLTTAVDADLGDMSNGVRLRFCRQGGGPWAFRAP